MKSSYKSRFFEKLKWRECSLLASVLIDNIGNGIHSLAIGKVLYDATGSVFAFGASFMIEYLLAILLQAAAGSVVDRMSPNTVTVVTDFVRGIVLLLAGATMGSSWSLATIWLCIVVINGGKPFARSASFALIPRVIDEDDMVQYYSLASAFFQVGQIIGIGLAGPLLALGGTAAALYLDGATYLVAGGLVGSISLRAVLHGADKARLQEGVFRRLKNDWVEVIQIIKADRPFFWNLVLTSGDFLAIAFLNLALVPLVEKRLNSGPYWLTVLDGSFAVAAFVGAFIAPSIRRKTPTAIRVVLLQAMAFGILALASSPVVIVGAYFLVGIGNALSLSLFMTSLQFRCKGPIKGRIAGMRHLIVSLLSAAFIPLVSLAHNSSLVAGLMLSGAIITVFAIMTILAQRWLGQDSPIIVAAGS